jgi:branched-subunit amino acid transport protein
MSGAHGGTDWWTLGVIVGLAGVTVLTRCFFFILDRPWGLPDWAHRALHYAPIAALAGVVVPEIVVSNGHLITTWCDARLYAALAGIAYFAWRRGVLGTMLAGMAVYLPLHLGLGW